MFFLTFIRTQAMPFECLPILVRDSQLPKSVSQMYIRLVFPMKITAARGQEPHTRRKPPHCFCLRGRISGIHAFHTV